jgi:hypothetical protein
MSVPPDKMGVIEKRDEFEDSAMARPFSTIIASLAVPVLYFNGTPGRSPLAYAQTVALHTCNESKPFVIGTR